MKLAFVIATYFPYGGLQRDFLTVVNAAVKIGHQVDVYCMQWRGEKPKGANVMHIPQSGLTNHTRMQRFAQKVLQITQEKYDSVIGFNKVPGLDIYFMGDVCFKPKLIAKPWLKLIPRYRQYASLEKKVFELANIFYIDKQEAELAKTLYAAPDSRFYLMPPSVERHALTDEAAYKVRQQYRAEWGLLPENYCLLFVASNFELKGLPLVISSMERLTDFSVKLIVVGDDDSHTCQQQARKLGLEDSVIFLGAREDVPELMASADLLVHPVRHETGGKVLIEALISNLPILGSQHSGYSKYIEAAGSGVMLQDITQEALDAALQAMLKPEVLSSMKKAAKQYEDKEQFFQFGEVFMNNVERISSYAAKNFR